jgi:hypothetical protein
VTLKTKVLTTQYKLSKGLILTHHRKVNLHFPIMKKNTRSIQLILFLLFSHTGQFIEIKYTADENGFVAQGMVQSCFMPVILNVDVEELIPD